MRETPFPGIKPSLRVDMSDLRFQERDLRDVWSIRE